MKLAMSSKASGAVSDCINLIDFHWVIFKLSMSLAKITTYRRKIIGSSSNDLMAWMNGPKIPGPADILSLTVVGLAAGPFVVFQNTRSCRKPKPHCGRPCGRSVHRGVEEGPARHQRAGGDRGAGPPLQPGGGLQPADRRRPAQRPGGLHVLPGHRAAHRAHSPAGGVV